MSFINNIRLEFGSTLSDPRVSREIWKRLNGKKVCLITGSYEWATIAEVVDIELPDKEDLEANPDVVAIIDYVNPIGMVKGTRGKYFVCPDTEIFVEV